MSGTISLSPTVRWSAASWLFDWVLNTIAEAAQDAELAADLTGVVGDNIAVRCILKDGLRVKAEAKFPTTMPGREGALALLDELSRLASDTA
jgi:hypothetical protein